MATVRLSAVVEALDTTSDEVDAYLQRSTGEMVLVFDPSIAGDEVLES